MIKLNNGDEVFLNQQKDSIFFKNNIQPNDSWLFYRYANGNYLNATLSSVVYDPTFGVDDSIRIVTLQLYDSANQAIADTMNSITFQISKQFGFKKLISLRNFPFHLNYYHLRGIESPALGTYNLLVKEIYDFEIGDIFHYEGSQNTQNTFQKTYGKRHIIDKQVYYAGDSIVYIFRDSTVRQVDDYLCPCIRVYLELKTDTGIVFDQTFSLLSNSGVATNLARIPYSAGLSYPPVFYLDTITLQSKAWDLNGRVIKDFHLLCYNQPPISMSPCFASFPRCGYHGVRYAQGLGFVTMLDNVSSCLHCCYQRLVYYEKGSEVWGTPVNYSLLLEETEIEKRGKAIITPNPFHDLFKLINLPMGEIEIKVYNSLGEIVKVQKSNYSESTNIILNEQKAGIYFVHIVGANGSEIHKLIKL